MLGEISLLRERFSSIPALVWLFTGMHLEVVQNIPCLVKSLLTTRIQTSQYFVHPLGGRIINMLSL